MNRAEYRRRARKVAKDTGLEPRRPTNRNQRRDALRATDDPWMRELRRRTFGRWRRSR